MAIKKSLQLRSNPIKMSSTYTIINSAQMVLFLKYYLRIHFVHYIYTTATLPTKANNYLFIHLCCQKLQVKGNHFILGLQFEDSFFKERAKPGIDCFFCDVKHFLQLSFRVSIKCFKDKSQSCHIEMTEIY